MTKMLSLILCMVLVLFLTACSNATMDKNDAPDDSPLVDDGSTDQGDAQTDEPQDSKPIISVDEAPGSLLGDPDSFVYFEQESNIGLYYAYSVTEDVSNFKFMSISFEEVKDDGTIVFSRGKELYALDTLTPQKPLVIKMYILGPIPSFAISFCDCSGNEFIYAIGESGEDGEPYLQLMGEGTNYYLKDSGIDQLI